MCAELVFKLENDKLHLHHVKKEVNVGTATKNIKNVYLDRTLRTVKKWFSRFQNCGCERPSSINNDCIRDLLNFYPKISTEKIAKKLNVDKSATFRH